MPGLAVTSNTGVVNGSTSPFTVTFPLNYQRKKIFLYVDYTYATGGSTIKIGAVNPRVAASSVYQEALFATANVSPVTVTLTSASGKFRFEFEPSYDETSFVVTVTIAGSDAAVVDLCRQ